jgi:peptidoglycan/xylan/chitin deacetylase (PgdA/CDA1 family)
MHQLKQDYQIVMWDVLSADYREGLAPEVCLSKTIRYTSPGSIVVFHDSVKSWERLHFVLPRFLEYFSTRGYTFDTL